MKWNIGDHGVVWREKYLPDSIAHLLGQEVIVVGVPRKSADITTYIPMYGDVIIVNSGKRDYHLTVRKYNSEDEVFYRVDTRCMSKTTRKIEKGSWNECPWVPNELKE